MRIFIDKISEQLAAGEQGASAIESQELSWLIEARDEMVTRTERYMRFLAILLSMIFLVLMDVVKFSELFGARIANDIGDDYFIYGGLFIGNLVALLHAGAMTKMFLIEGIIRRYADNLESCQRRRMALVSLTFFPYIFGILGTLCSNFNSRLKGYLKGCHYGTVAVIPCAYILFYVYVLCEGIGKILASKKMDFAVEMVLFLIFMNLVTASVYAFSFFPVKDVVSD